MVTDLILYSGGRLSNHRITCDQPRLTSGSNDHSLRTAELDRSRLAAQYPTRGGIFLIEVALLESYATSEGKRRGPCLRVLQPTTRLINRATRALNSPQFDKHRLPAISDTLKRIILVIISSVFTIRINQNANYNHTLSFPLNVAPTFPFFQSGVRDQIPPKTSKSPANE
jgi:hypothetical protein